VLLVALTLLAALGLPISLALLGGCASAGHPDAAREELDERSGVTLFVVQRPLVLARPRTDVAANARDYLILVAMQEDRSGNFSTWLIVHRWSTVDPRMQGAEPARAGRLRLIADDRELLLDPADPAPAALQRGDLLFRPHTARASSTAYAIDVPTLRFLAGAKAVSANYPDDTLPIPYAIWQDGRADLLAFADAAAPAGPGRNPR
jgi:hypothetical protein